MMVKKPDTGVKLRTRRPFLLSTYNVRTMKKVGRFPKIIQESHKLSLDVVAIQAHQYRTSLDTARMTDSLKLYKFIYSSADERGVGGVGILVKSRIAKSILKISKISDRILSVTLNSNPRITLTSA